MHVCYLTNKTHPRHQTLDSRSMIEAYCEVYGLHLKVFSPAFLHIVFTIIDSIVIKKNSSLFGPPPINCASPSDPECY